MNVTAEWKGLNEWINEEDKWQEDVVKLSIDEVEKVALRIERDSKVLVPVDTGELRGSISTDIQKRATGITTETGTDVKYSEVVEFGGSGQRAQPYLIPSFDKNVKGLQEVIGKIMKG